MQPTQSKKEKKDIERYTRIGREIADLKGKAKASELATRFNTSVVNIHDIWAKTKDRIFITFLTYTTVPEGRLTIHGKARVKKTLPDGTKILDELRFTHGELIPKE